jgi:hypothetical protein
MPKKRTQKIYFGEDQEKAVIRYLESETEDEKNKIFNEYLREPLIIMVESIIRRYKLYRKDLEFEEIHNDTMSFLMTKINKFDHTKNHKAYSYFGTICKNYLMGAIQKDTKELKRNVSYEDVTSELENRPDLVYVIDGYEIDYSEVIVKLVSSLEEFIENEDLNENEKKLGYALIEIFTNFDKIFQIGDGNKFNKNLILLSLREMTSLSTKEIRISLKKFKKTYNGIMLGFLN